MRRTSHILLWTLAGLLLGAGCQKGRFKEAQRLGGQSIAAKTLNRGHRIYTQYCDACHGPKGDGKGPAAPGTLPPPRDFTLGFFKYISVPDSGLPTDDDLLRSAQRGIPGTRMPPWVGISAKDLQAAIHYLKTFSLRWRKRSQGRPIPRVADPWTGRTAAAEARGEQVYHGAAQCWTCHPAYHPREAVIAAATQGSGAKPGIPVRRDLHRPAVVETRYGKLTPPDFLSDALKGGDEPADLYRTVAAGIGGTPMPTWYKRLPPGDLWAVVYYVQRLLRLQGTPEAKQLQQKLRAEGAPPVGGPDLAARP